MKVLKEPPQVFTSNKLGAQERSEGEVNLPVSEQREEMYRHIHSLSLPLPCSGSYLTVCTIFLIQTFKRPFRGESPTKWVCQGKYCATRVLITVPAED